jgi:hypothetical protein
MSHSFVIPAKAGIQSKGQTTQPKPLDARLRGHDGGESLSGHVVFSPTAPNAA